MPTERRRFSRVVVKVNAEITANGKIYSKGEIINLSMAGCLLSIPADVEAGTSCHLKILLSGTESEMSIEIDGEINRSDSGRVAVKFTRIDPDSLFHLRNIVRYNSPDADVIEREISKHPSIL